MQTQLRQAVVVAFGRTPYCKARKGSFAQLHPVEYGAQTLLGVLARVPQLRPEDIGDVIMGCAMPFGVQGGNMARLIVQRAGLPDCVTAQTVNRYCSSGLQTIATAANAIRCGEEDVVIAGGVESMSLVPMLVGRSSIGRLGIFVHVTAGFGDVGFSGNWTLELTCVQPVRVYPGMEICQIYYQTTTGEILSQYHGKYQGSRDVVASRIYQELSNGQRDMEDQNLPGV